MKTITRYIYAFCYMLLGILFYLPTKKETANIFTKTFKSGQPRVYKS